MISDVIRHITFLPVLPESITRLRELLDSSEGDLHSMAELIENDHTLAAILLKLGNSTAYNFSNRRVTNLRDIIARIGRDGLSRLLQQLSHDSLKIKSDRQDLYHIWQRSYVNRELVRRLERLSSLSFLNGETLVMAGHLQEIGHVIRAHFNPEEWLEVIEMSKRFGGDINRAEGRAGILEAHGELGARVLEQWRICSDITIPVRYHETPDQAPRAYRQAAHLLNCAAALHSFVEPSYYGKRYSIDQIGTILQMSGIDPRHLSELISFIHEESDRSRTMLSIWGMGKNFSKLRTTGSTSLLRPV